MINDRVVFQARTLFADIMEDMHDVLFHLRTKEREHTGGEIAPVSEAVKRGEAAILHLIKLQTTLIGPKSAQAAGVLDLQAAREEVLQRLARLAA